MGTAFDGLLVLDKPGSITSRDAVDRAARWFPRRTRIGHAGTLDPLATGVLVLCLGNATRLAEYVQRMGKTYQSLFRLGAVSNTDDADGQVSPVAGAQDPGRERIDAALAGFVGTVQQVPPAFSAAKVAGQRAYALARQGEEPALTARPVDIYRIVVLRYAYPELEVEVHCGKGTYIRSLARDVGAKLGCGAHVETLRRTRIGPFSCDDAVTLDMDCEQARSRLLPMASALSELPRVVLPAAELAKLRRGQGVSFAPAGQTPAGEAGAFDDDGNLVAVAAIDPAAQLVRPVKVLS
jgi:tRNA pseudouridine55 synthase